MDTTSSSRLLIFFVLLTILSLALTNCRKDDISIDAREALIRSIIDEVNTDSIRSHVNWLQQMGTRFALAENRRSVAVRIRNKFIAMGYTGAKLDSFFITRIFRNVSYSQWQYNVIALLPGSEYPDSLCILGSHYDDIVGAAGDPFVFAPGAHDNASGTAATLEIARIMKKTDFNPLKSVMFIAFGAEELGLLGSWDFANDPGEYDTKIAFMLNNDMIGYDPDPNFGTWSVNIIDYPNSGGLRLEAADIISRYIGISYINNNQYNKQSDSYPFSARGYKALFFSSVVNDPYYHSNNDVKENLNFDYCREVTRISCAILAEKNIRDPLE